MPYRVVTLFLVMLLAVSCQTDKKDELVASSALVDTDAAEDVASQSELEAGEAEENLDNADADEIDETVITAKIDPAAGSEAQKNTVLSYSPPKKGTVFTWRNNWANLPEIISYRVAGKVKNGDTEYLKLTSVKGFKSTTHALPRQVKQSGHVVQANREALPFSDGTGR